MKSITTFQTEKTYPLLGIKSENKIIWAVSVVYGLVLAKAVFNLSIKEVPIERLLENDFDTRFVSAAFASLVAYTQHQSWFISTSLLLGVVQGALLIRYAPNVREKLLGLLILSELMLLGSFVLTGGIHLAECLGVLGGPAFLAIAIVGMTVQKTRNDMKAIIKDAINESRPIPIILVSLLIFGCASQTPRNKWTDKTYRVFLSPEGLPADQYIQIQKELVVDGRLIVVDRGLAFSQIKEELTRTHRDESDKFAANEKYALWGKLYGVGGVIVGHVACFVTTPWWNKDAAKMTCKQFLMLADSNTGEILAAAEGEASSPVSLSQQFLTPPWADTVAKFLETLPKNFDPAYYQEPLRTFREISGEESMRQIERR